MVIKISILKKSIYINVCVKNGIQIKTNPFQIQFHIRGENKIT